MKDQKTTPNIAEATNDPHSFADPAAAIIHHLDLKLEVNFELKQLKGNARIHFRNRAKSDKIILDTRNLKIEGVRLDDESKVSPFHLESEVEFLGQALIIPIHPETKSVSIQFSTTDGADALQWLSPEQTAGKQFPFLFTQSQAILARTWVPVQDSPGIRFTYEAEVKVPSGLMAVMSAENPTEKNTEGLYRFSMKQPIPAYLLALAVGDFVYEPLDRRTGVYAEPVTIEKATYEFSDLPKMLEIAESLYGPYAWDKYDVIVLPPSFPFGGMENPRITFATPTILAGDRSLTSLIAHELAHSWSGNLVTNATWNDFWINEGFTVYFEARIMEALYGKDFADMQFLLGVEELKKTIEGFGDRSIDSHLKLQLDGRDPDEGMNEVAYEKGRLLLVLMEQTFGREKFDQFLKNHFSQNAFKTINTEQFIEYYRSELVKGDSAAEKAIDIERWVYGPGIPENAPQIRSERFEQVALEVDRWIKGNKASTLNTKNYSTNEWLRFIHLLPEKLRPEQMLELDNTFQFSNSSNSEILFAWLEKAVVNAYEPAYPVLKSFLNEVGRRKFVRPLFKAMIKTAEGRKMAEEIYKTSRPNYHSVTQSSIDEILYQN